MRYDTQLSFKLQRLYFYSQKDFDLKIGGTEGFFTPARNQPTQKFYCLVPFHFAVEVFSQAKLFKGGASGGGGGGGREVGEGQTSQKVVNSISRHPPLFRNELLSATMLPPHAQIGLLRRLTCNCDEVCVIIIPERRFCPRRSASGNNFPFHFLFPYSQSFTLSKQHYLPNNDAVAARYITAATYVIIPPSSSVLMFPSETTWTGRNVQHPRKVTSRYSMCVLIQINFNCVQTCAMRNVDD